MYMPYSQNPHLPRVRMLAVRMAVYEGRGIRQTARYFGVEPSTVSRWVKRDVSGGWRRIPTRSSRPEHHPRELPGELIAQILALRRERHQCAELLHHRLMRAGATVSLSSVKRVLRRHGLSRFSRWKKWHQYPPRPVPETPGMLVEIDTIHDGPHEDRLYVYTLLDVCSRFAYAGASAHITTHRSLRFIRAAAAAVPFAIRTLQSDHGPEFSRWFTTQVAHTGMAHRHSRVRQPNDNAHLERFNRTIQEECLGRIPRNLRSYQREIPEYLRYYNAERPHMGLQFKTPAEVLRSY